MFGILDLRCASKFRCDIVAYVSSNDSLQKHLTFLQDLINSLKTALLQH